MNPTKRHLRLASNAHKYFVGMTLCYLSLFLMLLIGRAGPIVLFEALAAMLGSVLLLAAVLYRVLSDYTADELDPAPSYRQELPHPISIGTSRYSRKEYMVGDQHVVGMVHDGVVYLLREDVASVLGTPPDSINSRVDVSALRRFTYGVNSNSAERKRAWFIGTSAIPMLSSQFPGPAADALVDAVNAANAQE